MEKELTYNTVIVGAGVSGLYAALKLPKEQNILLICKEDLPSCDSMLAQGGICVQRDETDYDSFFEDTLKAGHYENRKESVDIMIRNSRAVINDLLALGVRFDKEADGSLKYTREGAHAKPVSASIRTSQGRKSQKHCLEMCRHCPMSPLWTIP